MVEIRDAYDYTLHLAASAVNNTVPLEIPEGITFQDVFSISAPHEIVNLVFYAIEKLQNKPKEPLYSRWKELYHYGIVKDINQSVMAEEFRGIFRAAGIPFYELQGTIMKPFYPSSDMRTMSDMDFIIEPEYLSATDEAFKKAGYDAIVIHGNEIQFTVPPNILVEIHSNYSADVLEADDIIKKLITSEKKEDHNKAFYLFSVLHTAKHYYYRGCGMRRILDIYLLNRAFPEYQNDKEIRAALKKAKSLKFADICAILSEYWFGDYSEETPEMYKMGINIKTSPLHGVSDGDINKIDKLRRSYNIKGSKRKYVLRRFFPSLRSMSASYPVLRKCGYLLPVFWIYRFFENIFTKGDSVRYKMKKIFKG